MMQNINNFYKFASEDEIMTNFQRKYGIHNTSAPTHNRRHRKYARLANFSLPVGGIIDDPIELEPAYTTLMTRDYCGNYIYSNGALERILTDNGYIQDGEYYFYIKDYQGNIRVVLNQSNQPVELNSYYPYGALMAATTTEGTQPYKYSAKELDRENGLDLYDSQARHYDPIIPRTTTIDPLAEKYYSLSPYTWCAANPINLIDEKGDSINIVFDKSLGKLQVLDMDRYDPKKPLRYVSSNDYDLSKTNQVLVIENVFSGGKVINGKVAQTEPNHIPLPNGVYDILENKDDTNPNHKDWLRIDAQDSNPRNDKHDESGRDGFRLHLGTNSYGCITISINSKTAQADWKKFIDIINNTSYSVVGDRRGSHRFNPFSTLKKYGRIAVHE